MTDCRLIYRSHNAMNVAGPRLLLHFNDIVLTARRNNPRHGICGFLMFDRQRFHQILEGPEERIAALIDNIGRDIRNTNLEILERTPIVTRLFGEWSMGSLLTGATHTPLMKKHGIAAAQPLEAQPFLRFAIEFTNPQSSAA